MPSLHFKVSENYSSTQDCAFIDANGWFDLISAEAAGVDLSRVLWVRCIGKGKKLNAVEQALKAADILINGKLNLIIVDLSGVAERLIRKVPLTAWHRFSRAAERASTTLIFLTSVPVAQSCANIKIHIKQSSGIWRVLPQLSQSAVPAGLPHAEIISGIEAQCEILREKLRKNIKSVNAAFSQLSKRA